MAKRRAGGWNVPGLFAGGGYVEGWLVVSKASRIEIVESGWGHTADLRILDPTMVLREPADQPICYFAGFEIATEHLMKHTHGQVLPLVCHSEYGSYGMGHPDYKEAYEQARLYAHEQAMARQLSAKEIFVHSRDTHRRGITIVRS